MVIGVVDGRWTQTSRLNHLRQLIGNDFRSVSCAKIAPERYLLQRKVILIGHQRGKKRVTRFRHAKALDPDLYLHGGLLKATFESRGRLRSYSASLSFRMSGA